MTKNSESPSQSSNLSPKWSVRGFYTSSWKLLTRHKKLWILGIASLVISGGSGNFNVPNSYDSSDEPAEEQVQDAAQSLIDPRAQAQVTTDEYGLSDYELSGSEDDDFAENTAEETEITSESFSQLLDEALTSTIPDTDKRAAYIASLISLPATFGEQIKLIPEWVYVLGALEILLLVLILFGYGLYAPAWAEAALLEGIWHAIKHDRVELAETARKARGRVLSMLYLNIVPGIMFVVALLIGAAVGTLVIFLAMKIHSVVGVIAVIAAIFGGVYGILYFVVALEWSKRHLTVETRGARKAFKAALTTAKNTVWRGSRLIVINAIFATIVTLLVFVPLLLAGVPIFIKLAAEETVHPVAIAALVTIVIATIPFFMLVQGILRAFTTAVWQYGFLAVHPISGGASSATASATASSTADAPKTTVRHSKKVAN